MLKWNAYNITAPLDYKCSAFHQIYIKPEY